MTNPMTAREHSKQVRSGAMGNIRAGLRKVGAGNVHITKDFAEFLGFGMWPSDTKRIIGQMVKNREVDSVFENKEYHLTILGIFPEGKIRIPTFCEVREWVNTLSEGIEFSSVDIPDTADKKYWISRLQKMVVYGELVRTGKEFNAETHRHVSTYKVVELLVQHPRPVVAVDEPVGNEPKKIVWEPWPVVRKDLK